jgi:hypothetical protein
MTSAFRIAVPFLLAVAVLAAPPAWGQAKPGGDLTVVLSSLSTETLDPVLGGHVVKF